MIVSLALLRKMKPNSSAWCKCLSSLNEYCKKTGRLTAYDKQWLYMWSTISFLLFMMLQTLSYPSLKYTTACEPKDFSTLEMHLEMHLEYALLRFKVLYPSFSTSIQLGRSCKAFSSMSLASLQGYASSSKTRAYGRSSCLAISIALQ